MKSSKTKNELVVDARMINASGIGTVLKSVLKGVVPHFTTTLLGDPLFLAKRFPDCKIIALTTPIYSLSEHRAIQKAVPPCDLFWSPHFNVTAFPVRARYRIATIHDICHIAHKPSLSWPKRTYAKILIKRALQLSDRIVTVSQFTLNELQKHFSPYAGKCEVIPCGIDRTQFFPLAEEEKKHSVLKKYGLQPGYFLSIGNVKPHKNLKALVLAYKWWFSSTHQKLPPIAIVGKRDGLITGDKALLALIEEDAILKKNVHFTGYVQDEDLAVLYRSACALVFPSLYEGFGLPPLEAMACACPVLASDRASIPEVCGLAAFYFDPTDIVDLALKMQRLYEDLQLQRAFKEKGVAQAAKYPQEATSEAYLKLFASVCT